MGGENQRRSLAHETGYSKKAQCTGKPSFLKPNSQSLQKTYRGGLYVSTLPLKKIEDRSAIGEKHNQNHVENQRQRQIYLERIRNRMQKPIEGLSSPCCLLYIRGAIVFTSTRVHPTTGSSANRNQKVHRSAHGNQQQP